MGVNYNAGMQKQAPEIFQLPLTSIDVAGLPSQTDPGFEQAVIAHYALQYAAKGWYAAVVVSDGLVRVIAVPQQGVEPKAYLLGLLRHGFIADALPGLEAMYGMVDDADICFNYGVALSELGHVEDSLAPLNKCLRLDPSYDNAAIAIGVSLSKLKRYDEAEVVLKAAAKIQPDNALIKQNLAATLARAGKYVEALPFFRQAVSISPNPGTMMGLAQCLDSAGHKKEALKAYKELVKRFPDSPFTEQAIAILNRAGQADLRKVVDDGYRPDAVEYMIAAMKRFAELQREQVGRAVMEIGQLGQTGLEINNPSKRYSLTNLDGDFSGLQLLCYMHVGMALFAPGVDCGSGLQREYEIAKGMASQ
ncbi:MAG: tetratricopeptide repeat protein [Proteobacteria bacterium]|nr:tetratricopeptide repeat protein [Pseudomonadota bacterium]